MDGIKQRTITLKQRIVIMFIACVMIVFGVIILITNYTLQSIVRNKIDTGYQNNVKQMAIMLENTINNMNHVSQQLVNGSIAVDLEEYLKAQSAYERIEYAQSIHETMNLLTFTNPNIGLTMYVDWETGEALFYTGPLSKTFRLDDLPVLLEYQNITYYGPYPSRGASKDRMVLAAVRSLDFGTDSSVHLYIETSPRLLMDIMETDLTSISTPVLFVNNAGFIVYTQAEEEFPLGAGFNRENPTGLEHYHMFSETTNQGWNIITLVPNHIYMKERNQWVVQVLLLCLVVVGLCILTAHTLWKWVYRPLQSIDKKMENTLSQEKVESIPPTNIPEFDYLFHRFEEMREQIQEMIVEISHQEQQKAHLEIEKLRYQINPHFLMNTLNTVHWMSVMNGQHDIDDVVQALNRLLLYNLNKENTQATIAAEIQAIREYLLLQQVRYDFTYQCSCVPEEDEMGYPCPKFILQPLVENALYHGYRTDMHLDISVHVKDGWIEVVIVDDGLGMNKQTKDNLEQRFADKERPEKMGIGLDYVNQVIRHYYHGQGAIFIESAPGEGTAIHMKLPRRTEESHAESPNC